jgi:hypothetical protein
MGIVSLGNYLALAQIIEGMNSPISNRDDSLYITVPSPGRISSQLIARKGYEKIYHEVIFTSRTSECFSVNQSVVQLSPMEARC